MLLYFQFLQHPKETMQQNLTEDFEETEKKT